MSATPGRARSTPDPSEIAGRYQIIQKLGAGAFGTVYKARPGCAINDPPGGPAAAGAAGRAGEPLGARTRSWAACSPSRPSAARGGPRRAPRREGLGPPSSGGGGAPPRLAPEHRHHLRHRRANGISYLAMEFIDGVGLDRVISAKRGKPAGRARRRAGCAGGGRRSTSRIATTSCTATSSRPTS